MLTALLNSYSQQVTTVYYLYLSINVVIHLVFAGAVAKDGGKLRQLGQPTLLVSPYTWAFATLLGGIITAAIYWFMHHSTLTRPQYKDVSHAKATY